MRSFDVSVQEMPIYRVKSILKAEEIPGSLSASRQVLISRLIRRLSPEAKLDLMRTEMMAGRGSMSVIQFDTDEDFEFQVNFDGHVDNVPQIVTCDDEVGDTVPGRKHVLWAVQGRAIPYLATDLELKVEREATLVHSLWDPEAGILEVRSAAPNVRKIIGTVCTSAGLDVGRDVLRLSVTTQAEAEEFADELEGYFVTCHGDQLVRDGIKKMVGHKDPNVPDLRNTGDFQRFVTVCDLTGLHVGFNHDAIDHRVGFGFTTESTVFWTSANETTYSRVYDAILKVKANGAA